MDIKPIETFYNGYRFRSRLEAKWAVFFDDVGIPYEYETEGYVLPDGRYYLPDFYLPWFKTFVEVKRKSIDYDEKEIAMQKIRMLFESSSIECIAMLCLGDPVDRDVSVYCNYSDEEKQGSGWFSAWFYEGAWYRNRKDIQYNDSMVTNPDEYGYTKHFITLNCETPRDSFCLTNRWNEMGIECQERMIRYRNNFEESAKLARQARFEHGECWK